MTIRKKAIAAVVACLSPKKAQKLQSRRSRTLRKPKANRL